MTNNPYYYPEKQSLKVFESIDTAGSYEFDIFCIWEDSDGKLFWDTDSGCSCPTPFEDHGLDLKEITAETYYSFDQALKNHRDINTQDYLSISKRVRDFLKIEKA